MAERDILVDWEFVSVLEAVEEEVERVGRWEREGYWQWREREARGEGEVVWRREEEWWELVIGGEEGEEEESGAERGGLGAWAVWVST